MAMILLSAKNTIIQERLSMLVESGGKGACDLRLCDFDRCDYRMLYNSKESSTLKLSMSLPSFRETKGASDKLLQEIYGDSLVDPENGYDVTLELDLGAEVPKGTAEKFAMLRSYSIAGAAIKYFRDLRDGKKTEGYFQFAMRDDTEVYIVPGDGRVTVCFGMKFIDDTDREVARIFLQDSKEVGRRKVAQAPPVMYSAEKPLDLNEVDSVKQADMFFTMSIMDRHVKKDPVIAAINCLNFRNFLTYHLKCSKSYFHERMRKKVKQLLKVVNRAKFKEQMKDVTSKKIQQ